MGGGNWEVCTNQRITLQRQHVLTYFYDDFSHLLSRLHALQSLNAAVERGHVVEPRHLVITGALGRVVPARPGRYVAVFEACARLELEIR